MKIAILGSGDVGRSLASGLKRHGHNVTISSRDPAALQGFSQEHGIPATTAAKAAQASELLVLCPAWKGAASVCRDVAPHSRGKVVIDVTNPLVVEAGRSPHLDDPPSAAEQVQAWLPDAKVVKCWNIINHTQMVDPDFPEPPTMFLCGQHEDAKGVVDGLLQEVGWQDIVDLGPLDAARYLEGLAMVWIRTAMQTQGVGHAFRLVRQG